MTQKAIGQQCVDLRLSNSVVGSDVKREAEHDASGSHMPVSGQNARKTCVIYHGGFYLQYGLPRISSFYYVTCCFSFTIYCLLIRETNPDGGAFRCGNIVWRDGVLHVQGRRRSRTGYYLALQQVNWIFLHFLSRKIFDHVFIACNLNVFLVNVSFMVMYVGIIFWSIVLFNH